MNKVMVLKNNGENCAFPASTTEEIHAAALYILKMREERGFYPIPAEPDKLPYNVQYVKKVPHEPIKEFIRQSVANYTAKEKEYLAAKAARERIEDAISHGNGELAYTILTERKHREGERFEILNVIAPQSRESGENNE